MAARLRQLVSADFWRPGNRSWYGSFGVSVAVHLGTMLILGFTWIARGPQPEAPGLETRWSPAGTKPEITELEVAAEVRSSQREEAGGHRNVSELLQRSAGPEFELPAPAVESRVVLDRSGMPLAEGNPGKTVGGRSGDVGDLLSNGLGQGQGDGLDDGAGGAFFGIRSPGRRFVYVVDCSRSMNHPHPSKWKTRFQRLQFELVRSVGRMTPDQEFYIIFFNGRPLPMPASSLQPGEPRIKKRFLHWVARVRADGHTDPRRSLQMALQLEPDVIYFLTDGSFEPPIRRDLERLRQRRVSIHTFAFGNRDAEALLQEMAADNRGEYHFVP